MPFFSILYCHDIDDLLEELFIPSFFRIIIYINLHYNNFLIPVSCFLLEPSLEIAVLLH